MVIEGAAKAPTAEIVAAVAKVAVVISYNTFNSSL